MAAAISNSGYAVISGDNQTFQSYTYNEKLKWSIRQATAEEMQTVKNVPEGATNKDYVVIKNYEDIQGNGKGLILPYAVPKGYAEGQKMYDEYITDDTNEFTSKLSWGHVVYLSTEQVSNNITTQNSTQVKPEDKLGKMLADFFSGLLNGLVSALGLFSLEELMFNAGNRGATYYYGIIPMSWMGSVNLLNLLATVVATFVIGVSIIRMLIKRNIAAVTPSVKAELMDGVKDMFIVMAGVLMFMPALYILLNFNSVLVSAMRDMAPSTTNLGLNTGTWLGIVGPLMSLAYVFIQIMLNISYIVRAVTLALLIGFAPFFIALFAAGPASKKISVTWLKEIISNIFMQTFNAAILLIFANIGNFGTLSVIERFALLISFIPLTKFFKSALMNLGSGADTVAEKSGGAFSNLAAGMAIGGLGAIFDGKTPKGGKQQAGGSGGTGGYNDVTSGMTEAVENKESFMGKVGSAFKDPKATYNSTKEKAKSVINDPIGTVSSIGEKTKSGLKGLATVDNAKEGFKLLGKGAAVAVGAGVSLGSAATGGNPLLANKAMFDGVRSMGNQVEGWFGDSPEDPITVQGNELVEDGISGFNEGATMFTRDTKNSINDNEGKDFKNAIDLYNKKPEHLENPAEIIYDDSHSSIVGVKIPGVGGKTIVRRDTNTNKVISTESTYVGKDKLDNFSSEVLKPFVKKKE